MDELVYRFLLDSGFPRASVIGDLDLLPISGADAEFASPGADSRPDYAIIDPATLDRLALLMAVPALDKEALKVAADSLGQFARRFGGRAVQGFLVRIDPAATDPEASVQFYHVWPQRLLKQVSAHAFPDLDTLRIQLKLTRQADAPVTAPSIPEFDDDQLVDLRGVRAEPVEEIHAGMTSRPSIGVWLPGLVLAALAIADRLVLPAQGVLLDVEQAVLAVGAAALLLWAMVTRRAP